MVHFLWKGKKGRGRGVSSRRRSILCGWERGPEAVEDFVVVVDGSRIEGLLLVPPHIPPSQLRVIQASSFRGQTLQGDGRNTVVSRKLSRTSKSKILVCEFSVYTDSNVLTLSSCWEEVTDCSVDPRTVPGIRSIILFHPAKETKSEWSWTQA